MQSRCWRGCRTGMCCIDRLITILVLQTVCDIRWKRHLTKLIQHFLEDSFIFKTNQAIALFNNVNDFADQFAFAKGDTSTHTCLFPRLYQCLPDLIIVALQQQHLNGCPCIFLDANQSGWNDLCIIDNQTITRI